MAIFFWTGARMTPNGKPGDGFFEVISIYAYCFGLFSMCSFPSLHVVSTTAGSGKTSIAGRKISEWIHRRSFMSMENILDG